jgi:hypothetical protein
MLFARAQNSMHFSYSCLCVVLAINLPCNELVIAIVTAIVPSSYQLQVAAIEQIRGRPVP